MFIILRMKLLQEKKMSIIMIDDRPPHTRDFSRELGGFFLHLLMTYGII